MASRAERGEDYGPFDGCFNLIGFVALVVIPAIIGITA